MKRKTIEQGDVVQLIAGGPKMTVSATGHGGVTCVWFNFDYSGPFRDVFPTKAVQHSKEYYEDHPGALEIPEGTAA